MDETMMTREEHWMHKNVCPACGYELARQSGCRLCYFCGWSACG